jgi:hypothetical protein
MVESNNPNIIVTPATQQAEAALAEINPESFSPKAIEALKRSISWFIAELVDQSVKVSKRHRSDNVAESHVETAVQGLVGDAPGRIFRHLGTIGGVLLGAALSNFLSMITTNSLYCSFSRNNPGPGHHWGISCRSSHRS